MGSHAVADENTPTSGPTTETAVAPNAPSPGWQGATIKTSDPKPRPLRMYTDGVLEVSRGDSPPGRAEVLGYSMYGWFGNKERFERAYKLARDHELAMKKMRRQRKANAVAKAKPSESSTAVDKVKPNYHSQAVANAKRGIRRRRRRVAKKMQLAGPVLRTPEVGMAHPTPGEDRSNWNGNVFLKCISHSCPYIETCGFNFGDDVFTFRKYYCEYCGCELRVTP